MANDTNNVLADAERYRKHTENLLAKNSASVNEAQERNNESLEKLSNKLNELNGGMRELNTRMCGANVTDCSDVCGGAGCGFCGGLSCDFGAITIANQALDMAKQQAAKIKGRRDEAEQLLRNLTKVKQDAMAARSNAQDAFNNALEARNRTDAITKSLSDTNKRIWSMLNEDQPTPTMVRDLANKILVKNIQLKPDEITQLANRIKTIVGSLTDSDKILEDTKADRELAHRLVERANEAKEAALKKQNETNEIVLSLTEAKKAQELAHTAIDKAQSDVAKAQQDLGYIAVTIEEAQAKANDTTDSVKALDARLRQLQTQSAKNAFILNQEIEVETRKVAQEAHIVDGKTKQLEEEYKKADESLNYRVNKSKGDIQRAKKLLQRASELTADTSTKFKDLDGMESVYKENERILVDLMTEIDSLTIEMAKHLGEIERKSQTYRQCTS